MFSYFTVLTMNSCSKSTAKLVIKQQVVQWGSLYSGAELVIVNFSSCGLVPSIFRWFWIVSGWFQLALVGFRWFVI